MKSTRTTARQLGALAATLAIAVSACSSEPAQPQSYVMPTMVGAPLPDAAAAVSSAGARMIARGTDYAELTLPSSSYVVVEQTAPPGQTVPGQYPVVVTVVPAAEAAGYLSREEDVDRSISAAATRRAEESRAREAASGTVKYRVTGSGSASVTWYTTDMTMSQDTEASLPWTKTFDGGSGTQIYGVTAQHMDGSGDIGCEIYVDGQLVKSATSSGEYAVVSCTASGG